jgi:sec-independent protein translocase protein TatC
LINDKTLSKYRAHSFVIILIIAALITPPDIITQLILGVPMYLLFEVSIFLSRVVRKRAEKRELEEYVKKN